MFVYILLLSIVAFVSYTVGSVGTMRLAGMFVFHQNLNRRGKGSVWLSNFRRIYGVGGFIKLALVELVKDLIPILFGWLLLSLKGHGDVGKAFAGFCMVMARLWPVFNRFRGCHASVALSVMGLMISPSVGIACAAVCAIGTWFSRYVSLGTVIGAVLMIITGVLMVDDRLCLSLLIAAAALVILRHLPSLLRISRGQEERLSFKEDLTYKLDQKF